MEIIHRGKEIRKALFHRKVVRRNRRERNTRYRQARFQNRIKRIGWLAPSVKSRADNIINIVNKQSKSFCIDTKMSSGENVRFLFNDEGSDKDWERWIDIASSMLADNYLNSDNEMKRKVEQLNTPHSNPIFWTFNIEIDEWEPFDMKKSAMLDIERI